MSSCCGMPPKSNEAQYPMHPLLGSLVSQWEAQCPGILQVVQETVGAGNWEAMEGMDVPAYTHQASFKVASDCLADTLSKREIARLHREGPWLIRLGLSKPKGTLSDNDQAMLNEGRRQAEIMAGQLAPTWQYAGFAPVKINLNQK